MRIATHSYAEAMVDQYNLLSSKQYSLQNQTSTGLRIQSASDDPTAMQNTLDYVANKASQKQYSANIETLKTRGNAIYNALQSLQTISSRVGEITTAAGDPTLNKTSQTNYANEVDSLIEQTIKVANTKDAGTGQYLFGGTASTQTPYTAVTDANGKITGVTYNGNSNVNQVAVGEGSTTTVDIPGANTSSSGTRGLITDSQSGADLLNHLISLRDNLTAGNTTAITATDSANLQKDENNLSYQIANNGVAQNRLNAAATFATNNSTSLSTMISNQSSADTVATLVALNATQTAYQAALQSGSKILSLSILNYIS